MPGAPRQMEGADSLFMQSEKQSVHYFQSGKRSGWPVIFVHGTPGDPSMFKRYLQNPIPGTRIVAVARPGFGHTEPRRVTPSLRKQAAALAPFLSQAGERKPILVGHSYGGPVAAQAAADYPELVHAVVIIAGSLSPDLEGPLWWRRPFALSPMRWVIGRSLYTSNREIIALRGELEQLGPRLKEIQAPVYIMHGTNDWLVPYENTDYMKEMIPTHLVKEVITIRGGSHFLPWSEEDAIRDLISGIVEMQPAPQ